MQGLGVQVTPSCHPPGLGLGGECPGVDHGTAGVLGLGEGMATERAALLWIEECTVNSWSLAEEASDPLGREGGGWRRGYPLYTYVGVRLRGLRLGAVFGGASRPSSAIVSESLYEGP